MLTIRPLSVFAHIGPITGMRPTVSKPSPTQDEKGNWKSTDDGVEAKETRTAVAKDGVVIELMRTPTTSPEHVGIMLAKALRNPQIVWILLSDVLANVVVELVNGEVLADDFGQRGHRPTNGRSEITHILCANTPEIAMIWRRNADLR